MTGPTRSNCTTGQAQVLIVDREVHLWHRYEGTVPEGIKYLLVADTTDATEAVANNNMISTVVIRDRSRKHAAEGPDDDHNTVLFLYRLKQRAFRGGVIVVTTPTTIPERADYLCTMLPLQVSTLPRAQFFRTGSTLLPQAAAQNQVWELWERGLKFVQRAKFVFGREKAARASFMAYEPQNMLEVLWGLQQELGRSSLERLAEMLVAAEIEMAAHCSCEAWAEALSMPKIHTDWAHQQHGLYNRAVWELIAPYPFLRQLLGDVFYNEYKGPDRFREGDPRSWGTFATKEACLRMFRFLDLPDDRWFA
jgi:hypothetical protein